jgi:hypothetical protein
MVIEELLLTKGLITRDEILAANKVVRDRLGITQEEFENASGNGDVVNGSAEASSDDSGDGADQPLPDQGGNLHVPETVGPEEK